MPYGVAKSWYPTHLASEVAKRYLEAIKKYPPDDSISTPLIPVAVKTTKKGIETMAIIEIKKGKLEEAFIRAGNMMAMFNDIEGFEYSIERWATLSEALVTIGMKPPE